MRENCATVSYPVPVEMSVGTLVVDTIADVAQPLSVCKAAPRAAVDRARLKAARKRGRKRRGK